MLVGAGRSPGSWSLTDPNVLFIQGTTARDIRPLARATVKNTTRPTDTTAEIRGGATRLSWWTRNSTPLRMAWPSSTNRNSTMMLITAACG